MLHENLQKKNKKCHKVIQKARNWENTGRAAK